MCGIVGYIGNQDSKEILLKGLEKLEYRGYDSAGIAVINEDGVTSISKKRAVLLICEISSITDVAANSRYWSYSLGNTWSTKPNECTSASKCIRSFYTCS